MTFTACNDDESDDPTTGGNTTNEVLSGEISTNTTLTADKVYELAGKVVVPNGVTLTIEAGTIIKGRTGAGSLASALIVARGGKIMAEGTADKPIIMTSVLDNITIGQKTGSSLTKEDDSKWGGLIVLGKAPSSVENGDTEGQIEGIPADEEYGRYGGTDAADNSGVIKYVSVRHGGALIGDGNEINGITFGGVGSGTVVDYIEVVATFDDGIECFGGTVNISNALVINQGDDALDVDQNYSGTISNSLIKMGNGRGDEALELDGPEGSTYTTGRYTITNCSFISDGSGSAADLKSKSQGTISNCTFEGFTKGFKIRASFSDTSACTEKSDAATYLTDGSNKLEVKDCEFNYSGTIVEFVSVYTKSCEECDCASQFETLVDNEFVNNGNSITTSLTKGADKSVFEGWTWAAANSEL